MAKEITSDILEVMREEFLPTDEERKENRRQAKEALRRVSNFLYDVGRPWEITIP